MEKDISVSDILTVCSGTLISGDNKLICGDFCQDSRLVKQGDTYIGIKGEKFNGSNFYEQAINNGAKICILQDVEIDEDVIKNYSNVAIIIVKDVVEAIQKLAKFKREKYDIPVIAITGSVGKTSTKDIVASVLSKKYNVLKTEGNANNHIGLPLTMLRLKEHNAVVVEMGMNHLGEISVLTNIAKPTVVIITNVGTSHIGNLGTRENILKAKLEIIEGLQPEGTIIINNDNDMLHKWYLESTKNNVINYGTENTKNSVINYGAENKKNNVITYGIENKSDVVAKNIQLIGEKSIFNACVKSQDFEIQVPVGGMHFIYNSLCAVSVGNLFGVPNKQISQAITEFELTKNRMEIKKVKSITIINDCYNANYDSMKSAIEYLMGLEGNRKIAILGDMLELGDFSKQLHEKVGEVISTQKVDILITVGNEAKYIASTAEKDGMDVNNIYYCKNNDEAIKIISSIKKAGDCILVKASNGMNFKQIIDELK